MASIYQRADGLWCAAFTVSTRPRRRRIIRATTRDRLTEKIEAAGLTDRLHPEPTRPRRDHLADARAIETHTAEQWHALVRAHPKICRYCDTPLNIFNGVKDHIVSIIRGGSDGIGNLDYICWECNTAKRDRDDYTYAGPRPRPFRPIPAKRAEWERMVARRGL